MHWFALALVGLIIVAVACGGGTGDEGASGGPTGNEGPSGEGKPIEDRLREILEARLGPALIRDLPALEEEEARCISDALLAGLPDFRVALEDVESFAAEVLDGSRAAQESCLTPDRSAELEANLTEVLTREPVEEAFLLVVRGQPLGLDADDGKIVDAGYLLCAFAEEAGSLDILVERLAGTPTSSAKVVANLMPLLGRVLQDQELITFSTTAVVTLCPEVSGPSSTVDPP